MKKIISLFFALLLALSLAQAAAYIKFEGVDGEAQDKDHEGWCDLLSFSQPIYNPGGGAQARDVVVTKELDKATPKLAEAITLSNGFANVSIQFTGGLYAPSYFTIVLKNVLITSHNIGRGAEDRPTETITLNYGEISWTYYVRADPSYTVATVWDTASPIP